MATFPRFTSLPHRIDWDGLVAAGAAHRLEDQPQYDGDGRPRWHGQPPKGIACSIDATDAQLVAYVLNVGRLPRELYPAGTIGGAQWAYPKGAGPRGTKDQKRAAVAALAAVRDGRATYEREELAA